MIQAREVQRRYHGVCEGRMVAGQNVDKPIGRDPRHRTRQAVRDDGRPAYTEFRVEQRFRVHTLVEAQLGTGRTHQIRVHLKSIGYPLVGDKQYGARGKLPAGAQAHTISTLREFARQALHAYSLAFTHPVQGKWMSLEAPWPDDFAKLVACLENDLEVDSEKD